MNMHWISAIMGLGLAGTIFYLVRRDRLHGPYALWWLLVAAAALVLGFFPQLVDWLGRLTHVYYPPALPIIVGLALVMVRLLKWISTAPTRSAACAGWCRRWPCWNRSCRICARTMNPYLQTTRPGDGRSDKAG